MTSNKNQRLFPRSFIVFFILQQIGGSIWWSNSSGDLETTFMLVGALPCIGVLIMWHVKKERISNLYANIVCAGACIGILAGLSYNIVKYIAVPGFEGSLIIESVIALLVISALIILWRDMLMISNGNVADQG